LWGDPGRQLAEAEIGQPTNGTETMKNELDAEHISALCRGFVESRLMLTAVELDIFTLLCGDWLTAEEVALPRGWDARAVRILLDALSVVGLLDKRNERYSTTEVAAEMLSQDGTYSILDQALHGVELCREWAHLSDRVVGSGTRPTHDSVRAFIGTMELMAPRLAPGIAALVRPERGRNFLDVGGGGGAYTVAFLNRDRRLSATIFERPEVLSICAENLREAECLEHVTLVAGDLTQDEFPAGQHLVLLSAIVQMLSKAQNLELFKRAFRALLPGGRLIIRDYVMSADRLQPRAGTLFAVTMLVATEGGDTYTMREFRDGLESAGFQEIRLLQDGERMNAVIEAVRPRV
jgi:3-hydroxy-5-methyl-1-naphthoate 3-O-methyltransferase